MTKNEILKQLTEAAGGDLSSYLLGHFAGWSLTGVKTTKDEALKLAAQHGIDKFLKVPKITPPNAYARAVTDTVTGTGDTKEYEAILLESNEHKDVHAIVRRSVVEDAMANGTVTRTSGNEAQFVAGKEAKFDEVARVAFDKKAYRSTDDPRKCFVTANDNRISRTVFTLYLEHCENIRAQDVRIAFQRAFEAWHGTRVTDHGGMWWVPASAADEMHAWSKFLRALGGQPILIPIFNTDEARESLREIAAQAAQSQIANLKDKVEGFADNTRNSTIEKRMTDLDALRSKLSTWKKYLDVESTELEDAIGKLEKTGVDILLGREEKRKAEEAEAAKAKAEANGERPTDDDPCGDRDCDECEIGGCEGDPAEAVAS